MPGIQELIKSLFGESAPSFQTSTPSKSMYRITPKTKATSVSKPEDLSENSSSAMGDNKLANTKKYDFLTIKENVASFFKRSQSKKYAKWAPEKLERESKETEQKNQAQPNYTELDNAEGSRKRGSLLNTRTLSEKLVGDIGDAAQNVQRQLVFPSINIDNSQSALKENHRTSSSSQNVVATMTNERRVKPGTSYEQTATRSELPMFSLLYGEDDEVCAISKSMSSVIDGSTHTPYLELNHDERKNDVEIVDKKESNVRYRRSMSVSTSETSGFFSGSNTNLKETEFKSRKDDKKDDIQTRSTDAYVAETLAKQHMSSRGKFPSEPNSLQRLPLKTSTLTQENIFRINDSNVSIYNREGPKHITSVSSLFSSEQEIRDNLAEDTKELQAAHAKRVNVPLQKRLKRARKVLQDEGVLFIVDNKGSGSTHLAWDLLLADNSAEKFNLLNFDDFSKCLHSKGSVVILKDDVFGVTTLDESAVDTCLKFIKVCKMNRKPIKLIFTVKHHILNKCKRKLTDYRKCFVDLEDPALQLDEDEMIDIMKAMIENDGAKRNVHLEKNDSQQPLQGTQKGQVQVSEYFLNLIAENALPTGFPKRFRHFLDTKNVRRQSLDFFTIPTEDLLDEIDNMKRSSNESELQKNITLVSTAVVGGKLTLEKATRISNSLRSNRKSKYRAKDTKRAVEMPCWIEIVQYYTRRCKKPFLECVKAGINSLKGTYLKEEMKGVFSFAATCVENAVMITLAQDFPQHILRLCSSHFFESYVGSDMCYSANANKCVRIDILNEAVFSKARKSLLELADDGKIEAFAKHKLLRDQRFLSKLFDSFRKDTDRLWDISTRSDKKSGRCAVSHSLDAAKFGFCDNETGCFAYSLLLHKVWVKKKSSKKDWSAKIEQEVIQHCCRRGHKVMYFELRGKHNTAVDHDCLQAAVAGGSYAIVNDILQAVGKNMSDEQKCKCMELALLTYTRNPLKSRHDIVEAISKFISVDYKISGIDPIIHTAAKTGDARVIVTLEHFGGDINVTNSGGHTCLHEATMRNKEVFIEKALHHGADQTKPDKCGVLPIHEGARQNKPRLIRLLIGGDPDIAIATDKMGRQPLHYAAKYNSVEAAKELLEYDVEVDACDVEHRTPLHSAVASGKASVMHVLLDANADINKTDKDGNSPLLLACKTGNVKGVKRLLRNMSQTNVDASQHECLFTAVEQDQIDILKMLVDKGFDMRQANEDGKTLLCYAIEVNPDLVEYLVMKGADVKMPSGGRFPLHVAASTGNKEVFQTLVNSGANIEELTMDSNDSVLHIATANENEQIVDDILQKTDNLLGCRNKLGEVPLHIAARTGNLSLARTFLAHGAERSPINKCFQTPLCLAENKMKEIQAQINTDEYNNYCSVVLLLQGHRGVFETAL